jgi:hypothetical protein
MQLNSQDKEIIEQGIKTRFRELIKEFAEEKKESLKSGIISRLDPELSKTKRNDKDFALAEMILIDELLSIPELLKNRISNQTDISAEAETA